VANHRFFVRESRSYAGGWNPRFPMQYPRAYVRFMWFSLRDWFRMPNTAGQGAAKPYPAPAGSGSEFGKES
jgi:hypothetical protein